MLSSFMVLEIFNANASRRGTRCLRVESSPGFDIVARFAKLFAPVIGKQFGAALKAFGVGHALLLHLLGVERHEREVLLKHVQHVLPALVVLDRLADLLADHRQPGAVDDTERIRKLKGFVHDGAVAEWGKKAAAKADHLEKAGRREELGRRRVREGRRHRRRKTYLVQWKGVLVRVVSGCGGDLGQRRGGGYGLHGD